MSPQKPSSLAWASSFAPYFPSRRSASSEDNPLRVDFIFSIASCLETEQISTMWRSCSLASTLLFGVVGASVRPGNKFENKIICVNLLPSQGEDRKNTTSTARYNDSA